MMCGTWVGVAGLLTAFMAWRMARRMLWGCGGGHGGHGCHVGWRRHRGWGHHGHHGHHGGWGGPWAFRGMTRGLFRLLDTTPGQEKVISAELDAVRAALQSLRGEMGASRSDLAAMFRGETVTEAQVDTLLHRHDQKLDAARGALREAVLRIHDVLDPSQRAKLADVLGGGRPFGDEGRDL